MNALRCMGILTMSFLATIGFLAYNDIYGNIELQPLLPAVYQTNTAPMMLVSGNWTCRSTMETYHHTIKESELTDKSQWWQDCNPQEKCQTLMTWMDTQLESDGFAHQTRKIQYFHHELVGESCVETKGQNSMPAYVNNTRDSTPEYSYNLVPSRCLGQFTFRNLVTGDYLVESTYNMRMLKKWMKSVGKMYDVKYLAPCLFDLDQHAYGPTQDHRMHCVLSLKPIQDMSSYDIVKPLQLTPASELDIMDIW